MESRLGSRGGDGGSNVDGELALREMRRKLDPSDARRELVVSAASMLATRLLGGNTAAVTGPATLSHALHPALPLIYMHMAGLRISPSPRPIALEELFRMCDLTHLVISGGYACEIDAVV